MVMRRCATAVCVALLLVVTAWPAEAQADPYARKGTWLETMLANAEKRAVWSGEREIVPRMSDLHAIFASTSGKLERRQGRSALAHALHRHVGPG